MKKIVKWFGENKSKWLKMALSLPILLSIFVSIWHVATFFSIANTLFFSNFLSIAIEIGALTTLLAIIFSRTTFSVYIPFILITFYQILGNIFYSYNFIDATGFLFKTWSEFVNVLIGETITVESMKLWLAVLEGAAVPILSLLSLHLLVKLKLKEDDVVAVNLPTEAQNLPANEILQPEAPIITPERDKELKEVYNNQKMKMSNVLPQISATPVRHQ